MNAINKHTRELILLSQLFILQEYGIKDIKLTSPSLANFFRKKAAPEPEPKNINTCNSPLPVKPPSSPINQTKPLPTKGSAVTAKTPLTTTTSQTATLNKSSEITNPFSSKTTSLPATAQPQSPVISSELHLKEIALEPLNASTTTKNFEEFWKFFPNLFPDLPLLRTIPNDALAHKIKNAWMQEHILTPIIILSFDEQEKHLKFIKNIAHAISLHLAPARVLSAIKLEKENGWNSLLTASSIQLIIASDYGLYLQPELMKTYREHSQTRKFFLKHIPLLLLSEPSLYLKEPTLKSLLWRAICNEFAFAQHSSTSS